MVRSVQQRRQHNAHLRQEGECLYIWSHKLLGVELSACVPTAHLMVQGLFRLAALQSAAGKELLQRVGRSPEDLSSIVLVSKRMLSLA